MNNFSDLLATDLSLNVTIVLTVIHDNGYPGLTVRVNNSVVEYLAMTHGETQQFQVDLLEPLDIEIVLKDKIYDQNKETAVIIESLTVDGFELANQWTHLATYHSDQGLIKSSSYLGFNGTWRLTTDQPFYQWRHQITGQGWLLKPIGYEGS